MATKYKYDDPIEKMATQEIGEEWAKLVLISDYGVNRYNEQEEKPENIGPRLNALYDAYWARSDAESLNSFFECHIEDAIENGLKIQNRGVSIG